MRHFAKDILLLILLLILIVCHLTIGSVYIPFSDVISFFLQKQSLSTDYAQLIMLTRLSTLITAILAGIGLSLSGSILQSIFRNPVAGPYLLGISSGGSLAIALLVMSVSSFSIFGLSSYLDKGLTILASMVGSMICLLIMLAISYRVKSTSGILIVGLMFSGVFSSITSILESSTASESLQRYVIWTLGSYKGLSTPTLWIFFCIILLSVITYFSFAKALSLLQIGEDFAQNLGVNINSTKWKSFVVSGVLAGAVTAFCGPIAFIGFAVPHIVRKLYHSSNHFILLPRFILMGAIVSLFSSFLSNDIFPGIHVPLNAITSFLGAPYIIWVLLSDNQFKKEYA